MSSALSAPHRSSLTCLTPGGALRRTGHRWLETGPGDATSWAVSGGQGPTTVHRRPAHLGLVKLYSLFLLWLTTCAGPTRHVGIYLTPASRGGRVSQPLQSFAMPATQQGTEVLRMHGALSGATRSPRPCPSPLEARPLPSDGPAAGPPRLDTQNLHCQGQPPLFDAGPSRPTWVTTGWWAKQPHKDVTWTWRTNSGACTAVSGIPGCQAGLHMAKRQATTGRAKVPLVIFGAGGRQQGCDTGSGGHLRVARRTPCLGRPSARCHSSSCSQDARLHLVQQQVHNH